MRILFVSSEVVPFAKAGGLADVSHHLPKALAKLGHEIHVATPMYREAGESDKTITDTGRRLVVPISFRTEEARLYRSDISESVTVHLIQKDDLYNREGLYGNEYGDYEDNAERFIFFSRAVLELCKELELEPDVIHCNDWQAGLTPLYMKSLYREVPQIANAGSLFTIHNLGNQGIFWSLDMHLTGLGWEYFNMDGLEFYGNMNLMKAGIVFADRISTVSHTYAKEILTPEFGFGLDGVLLNRKDDLSAILNGVDYNRWDPSLDRHITSNFNIHNLQPKALCKKDLLSAYKMDSDASLPVVAMITRLVGRKGFDLLAEVFDDLIDMGLRFVIMGKGEDRYHSFLNEMAGRHPGKVGLSISYDYSMAHRIEAGADLFLNPSLYEPCGLDHMYGMRYGTIPVVRATGGLDETVKEYNPDTGQGTGFRFYDYSAQALLDSLRSAVNYYNQKEHWMRLVRNAMQEEFSWEKSAKAYLEIYESIARKE